MSAKTIPITASTLSIASSPERSASLNITTDRLDRHNSYSYTPSDGGDQTISSTAIHMYDAATWRMYYRIMNERKRRADIAERLGLPPAVTEITTPKPAANEAKGSSIERREDSNADVVISTLKRPEESYEDDGMFPLDL